MPYKRCLFRFLFTIMILLQLICIIESTKSSLTNYKAQVWIHFKVEFQVFDDFVE